MGQTNGNEAKIGNACWRGRKLGVVHVRRNFRGCIENIQVLVLSVSQGGAGLRELDARGVDSWAPEKSKV